MPHILVEYSQNVADKVDVGQLCEGLHHNLAKNDGLKLEATKTRSHLAENVFVGAPPYHSNFIHVTISLLSRFSDEGKNEIAAMMQKKAEEYIVPQFDKCNITVEVRDLQGYVKSNT